MKLIKYLDAAEQTRVGMLDDGRVIPLDLDGRQYRTLFDLLEDESPAHVAQLLAQRASAVPLSQVRLLPPLDNQEVWAAGVTYRRSQTARMEESESAASCYDRVYTAARPELFFKATPHRVVGHGGPLRLRVDSIWNVPEPELALVLSSRLALVAYTIGNDMSSRDIEGENPLYLPQAKIYDGCCALGPCVTLAEGMGPRDQIGIQLRIRRDGAEVFAGTTSVGQMARSFENLIEYLGRDNSFPRGVVLLTGTGIVPQRDFSLKTGDMVEISIDGIGTLSNAIVQG